MIFKTCSCCRRTFTLEQWRKLAPPPKGLYSESGGMKLEFRNCSCGSTMTVEK